MKLPEIAQALDWATAQLQEQDTARLDAQVLLCFVLQKDRAYLYTWPDRKLDAGAWAQFQNIVADRVTGLPVAHLTGKREFWSLPLAVNASTLIPRPATESLVELVLAQELPETAKVLDLGTGTGAIALALASEQPQWKLQGLDQSKEAVALAQNNQSRLDIKNIRFYASHWFDAVADKDFDCIVSNPPYIDADDPHLQQGDVRFEPLSALVAPDKGLEDLAFIIATARNYLKPGGLLALEHGYQQGLSVRTLMQQAGYQDVATICDYEAHDRVTYGHFIEKL